MSWEQVEALEKSWKGPKCVDDNAEPDPSWEPIDGFRPYLEAPQGPPQDSLVTEIGQPVVLTSECITVGKNLWKGMPTEAGHFHCYSITNDDSWGQWRANPDFPRGQNYWYCSNIYNAFMHYSWSPYRGGNFNQLSWALQCAMRQGNQGLVAVVCLKIFDWGGVRHGKAGESSVSWIKRSLNGNTLIADINKACQSLRANSRHSLTHFGGNAIPMNSGTTKIFSAVGMDFSQGFNAPQQDVLILDGRVGAALGLIARKIAHNLVPRSFRFPWGSGRMAGDRVVPRANNRRNPSCAHITFPMFSYGNDPVVHMRRAEFTRRGAECIHQILGVKGPSADFIKAEKGLFMIGYDVRSTCGIDCQNPRHCP